MIEKDNIQDLFSKAFENHTSPVRPDLWTGVQAKMSAAAGATGGSVAVKGISALTKWIVGTAAVTTIGVTTYLVTNNTDKPETKQPAPVVATNNNNPASENPIQNQDEKQTVAPVKPSDHKEEIKDQMVVHYFGPKPGINLHSNDDIRIATEPTDSFYESIKTLANPTTVENPSNKTTSTAGSGSSTSESNKESSSAVNSTSEETANVQVAEAKIELPNIFTPNGDGANDFCQFLKAENVKSAEITIVDQNNNPIYKTDDVSFKWDGTLPSGEQARIGIYTVLIIYTDMADKVDRLAKPIYLQR